MEIASELPKLTCLTEKPSEATTTNQAKRNFVRPDPDWTAMLLAPVQTRTPKLISHSAVFGYEAPFAASWADAGASAKRLLDLLGRPSGNLFGQ